MTVLQHEVDVANDKVTSQYPDELGIITIEGVSTGLRTPLFIADRPIYIDSFSYRFGTASATPSTAQHSIGYALSGSANTTADNNKVTETIIGDGAGGNMLVNVAYTGAGLATSEDANRVPTGALVCLVQTAVNDQANGVVTVRYRSRPA